MALPQILAITVTIAFEGLMLFQRGPDSQKNVAIVDASDPILYAHKPLIDICHAKSDYKTCETLVELQKDDTVTFNNSPGKIDLTDLYREHVPELRDFIVYGGVDALVEGKQLGSEGALAFVDLPAGRLTTWGGFDEKVQITKKGGVIRRRANKCFARYVLLATSVSPTTISVKHKDENPVAYPIEEGDLLFVSNISQERYHLHFPVYTRLLTNYGQLGPVRMLPENDEKCDPEVGKRQFPEIKDALENRYNRVPHGDCGPTGP